MKVNSYSFAASVVAFSATVLALPALYKRAGDAKKVFECFATAIGNGKWPTDCAAAVLENVGIVQKIGFTGLNISYSAVDPTTLGFATSIAVDLIKVPIPNFVWPLTECGQHVILVDDNNTVASFDNPTGPISVKDGVASVNVNTAIKIQLGQEDNFSAFMAKIITQANHTFTIRGYLNATVKTNAPPGPFPIPASFQVTNVGYEAPISLKGCANFPNIGFLQQGNFTLDPATGFYILKFTANINNPAQLVLALGDVTYQLTLNNEIVGTVLFDDVNLIMGDNPLSAIATITSKAAYDTLISVGASFGLQGFNGSSTHPILSKALESAAIVSSLLSSRSILVRMKGFDAFMAALIFKPEHTFVLRGSFDVIIATNAPPPVPESVRITNIGFGSNITLKGCNNFPKVDYLEQVSLTLDSATGVFTLTSLINVENLSQLDLTLGDVTFQTADKNGLVVGDTVVKGMRLKIGSNKLTAISTSSNKELYDTLTTVGATITLSGTDHSSPNPFVAGGVKNVNAQVEDVGIIQMIRVADLKINFFEGGSNSLSLSSTKLSGDLLSFLGYTYRTSEAAQHATIVDNGTAIATFDTPPSAVEIVNNTFSSVVQSSILTVLPGQNETFGAFMAALVSKSEHTFILRGTFDAIVKTNAPAPVPASVRITGIGFGSNITLKGCNNFPKVDYLEQVSLTLDSATGVFTLTSLINVENLSQLDLTLGDVTFQTADKNGLVVGDTVVKGMNLIMGSNKLTAVTTSSNKELYDTLTTVGATITLSGTDTSSPNPFVTTGVKAVKITVVVPKLKPAA
ncbi:MAG: hypothetical protein J3Q66DRAFT_387917 [Benniella sp.]|nr:MAG: hypothetical protein J3Q66DRAFT_387917 [Benniella sp.]